jgi:hypothetical protein
MQATHAANRQRFGLAALHPLWSWAMTPMGIVSLWGVSRAIMFINLVVGHHYCDPQFYQYAGDLAVGKLPYFQIPVEYPPLAMLVMLLPAIPLLPFSGIAPRPELDPHPWSPDPIRYQAFGISFGIMMLIIDGLTLLLVMRVARRWSGDKTGAISGLLYIGLIAASGAVLQKFELLVGTLCLLAIVMLVEKREGWAWALLAMATLVKGYPILLAPLFIIWTIVYHRFGWDVIRRIAIGGGLTSLVLVGPILAIAGAQPLLHSILYHADRGIEIESVWSSLLMLGGWLGGWHPTSFYNPADLSADIGSPIAELLLSTYFPILLGLMAWLYMTFWERLDLSHSRAPFFMHTRSFQRQDKESESILAMCLIHAMLVGMMIFLLSFRALGLHYVVGILPLVAVVRLPGSYTRWWLGLLAGGLIVGQLTVSSFSQLTALDPNGEILLLARNGLLIASLVTLARAPLLTLWKEVLRRSYHDRTALAPNVPESFASSVR